jgi:hypothetical protein
VAGNVTGRRFRLVSPATANVLAILGAALLIAAVPLTVVNRTLADPRGGAIIPVIIASGAVGLVVARRQPRNPVGSILLGFAVLMAASDCAGAYAAFI